VAFNPVVIVSAAVNLVKTYFDMKTTVPLTRPLVPTLLLLIGFVASTLAQDVTVSIPDPDLNAAVREALQKPTGPLTQQDLLRLTVLNACCRKVK